MLSRQDYIDFLLDHYENPRNHGALGDASASITGGNPGCGDVLTIYLKFGPDEKVEDVTFEGEGCTISQASASILTEVIKGKTIAEVDDMDADQLMELLGREVVVSRPKCATLSLDTMKAAIRKYRHDEVMEQVNGLVDSNAMDNGLAEGSISGRRNQR
ncbi:MAG: SUF system NifU family Fe-S cluster assembly protein [Chloroflexi bacterium]|nr:SUF system NifU family Fe-S cluster assembly protein [Chloroflexota bacterium]